MGALDLMRPIRIFFEAFAHPSVRIIAIVFLLMQIGFSLYFQLVLVYLKDVYQYSNWQLGVFNGFIGLCFGVSLIAVLPITLKYLKINTIAVLALLLVGLGEVATIVVPGQILAWIFAVPVGIFDMVAYTALLTAFSNAADADAQGWVMGISGAVMALSWALTGLSTNLLPLLGSRGLIVLGGIFLLLSAVIMWVFANKSKRIDASKVVAT